MPTDEIADVVNTPGVLKKVGKGSWFVLKYGFLATALSAAFTGAVAASPALGAGIASGKIGIGEAAWESGKHWATEFVPSAWEKFPDSMTALKNTMLSGSAGLSELLAPEPS